MKKPSKEELDFLLEGSSLTSLGRDFSYGAFDRKPLGPCPVTLPHCLSAAISSIGTQRQTYLNNFIGQSALMYLMEGYDSPVRYYVTWVFEGTVARPVASDKDGVTTSKGKFRPFVLAYYKGRIAFRDVYPKAHLEMEAKKDNPVFRLEGGVWVSDVRREAVAHLGIDYEVCSSESLGKCILANMAGLYRHAVVTYQVKDPIACQRTLEHLNDVGFSLKADLIDHGIITADDLNHLVATRQLFFPLAELRYFDINNCYVFRDENAYLSYVGQRAALNNGFLEWGDGETIQEGGDVQYYGNPAKVGRVTKDGLEILLGEHRINLSAANAALLKREKVLVRKPVEPTSIPPMRSTELREAQFRDSVLGGYVKPIWPDWHRNRGKPISVDTLADWRNCKEHAEAKGLDRLEALRPNFHMRGSHGPVIPETESILVDVLREAEQSNTTSTVSKWYQVYKDRVLAAGYGLDKVMAYDNFRIRVHNHSPTLFIRIRKGESACYQLSEFSPYKKNVFFDGDLHCAVAQADHMSIDIGLEHALHHKPVEGKALWLTVMVNISPIFPLAHVLTMHRTNASTTQLLLLECIRRNGFLPPFVIMDNEGNFDCLPMHAVLCRAESSAAWRGAHKPRHGSEVESFFHKVSVQMLRGVVGSYLGVQDFERLNAAKLARNKDLMTLPELNVYLDTLFYEHLYNAPGPDGRTPNEYIAESRKYNGEFHLKPLKITQNWRRYYMPPISNDGSRKIRPGGTVVG